MTIDEAFAKIRNAFPTAAEFFDGAHFKYASANGVVVIEKPRFDTTKRCTVFSYWLLVDGRFRLFHQSQVTRFRSMRTVGESFSAVDHGDQKHPRADFHFVGLFTPSFSGTVTQGHQRNRRWACGDVRRI